MNISGENITNVFLLFAPDLFSYVLLGMFEMLKNVLEGQKVCHK
jgi:hypothetical protein